MTTSTYVRFDTQTDGQTNYDVKLNLIQSQNKIRYICIKIT